MRLLADASVEAPVVAALRSAGHDVLNVHDIDPRMPDDEVILLAHSEGRVLITNDKDFGDLVFHRAAQAPGVLLLRFGGEKGRNKGPTVVRILATMGDRLRGAFTVASRKGIRSRTMR